MDNSTFLELVQLLDGVALPRDDAEPGSVNGMTAILCGGAGVGCEGHVNAPDCQRARRNRRVKSIDKQYLIKQSPAGLVEKQGACG